MSSKKFGPLVILFLVIAMTSVLDQSLVGQATLPATSSTAPALTAAATGIQEPRPPTHKDVAELEAAMKFPGSSLSFVAIVGNYAYAGAHACNVGSTILAMDKSGKWTYIIDDAGAFSAADMVEIVPDMPLPVAQALEKQAQLSEVYWPGNAREDEWKSNIDVYDSWRCQGDEAAEQGDFAAAIAAWTKGQAIDVGDLVSCREQAAQTEIRAAKDAKARMEQLHLTKEEASSWFTQHSNELWKQTRCDNQ